MPVPPEAAAVAVPSAAPLQLMLVPVIEEVIGEGSVMVTSSEIAQPNASVIFNVYVPAPSTLVKSSLVGPWVQEIV